MPKSISLLTCLFALTGLAGCSGQIPVEVELKANPLSSMIGGNFPPNIIVTSKVDQIKVNTIEINRGNCKVSGDGKQLKFGQSARFSTYSCDEIKEVEVDTDDGAFIFTF